MNNFQIETCEICGIDSHEGSPVYIFTIEAVTEEFKEKLILPSLPFEGAVQQKVEVPEGYPFWFYGGYGSIAFDTDLVFLTKEQGENLATHICENCLLKKLANQEVGVIGYFDMEPKFSKEKVDTCGHCHRPTQDEYENQTRVNLLRLEDPLSDIEEVLDDLRLQSFLQGSLGFAKVIWDFSILGFDEFKNQISFANAYFLTKQQAEKLPTCICEQCLREVLFNQEIAVYSLNDHKFRKHIVK